MAGEGESQTRSREEGRRVMDSRERSTTPFPVYFVLAGIALGITASIAFVSSEYWRGLVQSEAVAFWLATVVALHLDGEADD